MDPERSDLHTFILLRCSSFCRFDVFEMTEGLDPDLIPEETLLQYMARMGTPSRVLDMADAIMANDYGAEMSQIGLKETVCPKWQEPFVYDGGSLRNFLCKARQWLLEIFCAHFQ